MQTNLEEKGLLQLARCACTRCMNWKATYVNFVSTQYNNRLDYTHKYKYLLNSITAEQQAYHSCKLFIGGPVVQKHTRNHGIIHRAIHCMCRPETTHQIYMQINQPQQTPQYLLNNSTATSVQQLHQWSATKSIFRITTF